MTIQGSNRQRLIDKYRLHGPPDLDDPIVQAMFDAEKICEAAHGRDNTVLFGPSRCPAMWERANDAMRDLRIRIGLPEGDPKHIRLENDYGGGEEVEDLPTDAVVLWDARSNYAQFARAVGPFPSSIPRPERFSWYIQYKQEVDDYWRYGKEGNPRYPADYELRCTVNIASGCTAPLSPDADDFRGGTTRLMVLQRGQFILLFRCCRECEQFAGELSDTNYQIAVMEAHERLADMSDPAWARSAPRWRRWKAAVRRWFRRRL